MRRVTVTMANRQVHILELEDTHAVKLVNDLVQAPRVRGARWAVAKTITFGKGPQFIHINADQVSTIEEEGME